MRGFTLLELLITIAILAVVSTIGVVFYFNASAKARDSRRFYEIDTIAKALEVNKNSNSSTYSVLSPNYFLPPKIPTDQGNAQNPQASYCVAWNTSLNNPPLPYPTDWPNNSPCPTQPPVNWQPVNTTNPPANTTSWIICAFLEKTGRFYCQKNSI